MCGPTDSDLSGCCSNCTRQVCLEPFWCCCTTSWDAKAVSPRKNRTILTSRGSVPWDDHPMPAHAGWPQVALMPRVSPHARRAGVESNHAWGALPAIWTSMPDTGHRAGAPARRTALTRAEIRLTGNRPTPATGPAMAFRPSPRANATREPSTMAQQGDTTLPAANAWQVFYVNIGRRRTTVRPDPGSWWTTPPRHHVGVASTNGVRITAEVAARLAASDYVDASRSAGRSATARSTSRRMSGFAMAVRALE